MAYRDILVALSTDSRVKAVATLEAYVGGKITGDQFIQLLAAIVATANNRAVALADLAFATALTVKVGAVVPTMGLAAPVMQQDRLRKGAATLLGFADSGIDATERVGRFAFAEPLKMAQDAWANAVKSSGRVSGWRRNISANACQLCQWWSRDGRVWSDSVAFQTHKGCTCTPDPVI
jgi:hypothetical protein